MFHNGGIMLMTPPPSPSGAQRPTRSARALTPGANARRPNYLVPSNARRHPAWANGRSGSAPTTPFSGAAERLRRRSGNREVLRRALSPPARKRGVVCCVRRWNFRPTPSRLSNMSLA